MTDNKNNEMVFELPSSQKKIFWILIGMMAGIMVVVVTWLLIPSLSHRYVITDEKMVYSGKNFWLQDIEKEVPMKDIAKVQHTSMFFILYDKYDTVIYKGYVNNYITPRVSEELYRRIDLQPVNKQEEKRIWKWLLPVLVLLLAVLNLLKTVPYFIAQRKPTKATEQFELAERYRKAAEQDHADAQVHLGICYEYGHGVGKNYQKSLFWYPKAQEHFQGKRNLDKYIRCCTKKMNKQ